MDKQKICPDPTYCCLELSRVWVSLGNPPYNGKSASEQITDLIAHATKRIAALKEYAQHKRDCQILVHPASRSMDPWPVQQELRDRFPKAYGKYVCTCGLDNLVNP